MKKTLSRLIFFVLCISLVFGLVLSGCSSFPAVGNIDRTPDLSYAVVGNGTSAVQVGNFVYFINGIEDLTDVDGDTNKWGDVVKGALYRTELVDGKDKLTNATVAADKLFDPYQGYYGDYKTYSASDALVNDTQNGFSLKSVWDYENIDKEKASEEFKVVDAIPVVPKKISSGIYVFGDWIYYSTPSNLNDKQGVVQHDLREYYRTRHNGKDTQLLYRSANAAATHGFYYLDGNVYLVVLDGTDLISVKVESKKVRKPVTIAADVTTALFATKPVWTTSTPTNQVEDFVYYTRATDKDDEVPNGNVLERIRPDGNEDSRFILSNNGFTITLNAIKTGYVYYTQVDSVGTKLFANTFAGFPISSDGFDPSAADRSAPILITANAASLADMFVANQVVSYVEDSSGKKVLSATHYVVATKNSSTISITYPSAAETVLVDGFSAKVLAMDGNYVYCVNSAESGTSGILYKINMFEAAQTPFALTIDSVNVTDNVGVAVVAGYVIYPSAVNVVYEVEDKTNSTHKTTTGYMKLRRVLSIETEKEWQIYTYADKDIPEADPDPEE